MTVSDRIKGAMYGMALGDALGLGTEFMTHREVKSYYPQGLTDFSQFIRDMHRSLYTPGEWTNDTEIILRMLEPIVKDGGKIDIKKVCLSLLEWYHEDPDDLATPYRMVFNAEGWADNPIVVCHKAWRSHHLAEASNEALLRSFIIGLLADKETPLTELTRRLVEITHDDSRCLATTTIASLYIKTLIYEGHEPSYDDIIEIANQIDSRVVPFIKMAKDGNFDDFHIDDEETLWYTRKTLGIVLWTIWHCNSPEEILLRLVNAGGDADTNAALGMMIAGVKYGYDALPPIKEKLRNSERLEKIVKPLIEIVEKRIKD